MAETNNIAPLTRIVAPRAADLCETLDLSEEGRAQLAEDMPPALFVERLIAGRHYVDAITFLSHALPKRQATWWACLAARRGPISDPIRATLEAAEQWVMKPTDENGRKAMEAALDSGVDTPAGMAAIAAFCSGGSVTPEGFAVVAPDAKATGQTVFGAILNSAFSDRSPDASARALKELLAQGLDLARGGSGKLASDPAE